MNRQPDNKTGGISKYRAPFLIVLLIFVIEVALFAITMFYNDELITMGRAVHYVMFVCGGMCALWGYLPDGKLTMKYQILFFSIIPLFEFILVQLLGISNWWGILFYFVYGAILGKKFDMDFEDDSPTGHGGTGEFGASLFEGFMRGILKR